MSLERLIELARGKRPWVSRNAKMVKEWWPKPTIRTVPKQFWGDRWTNANSGCEHRFECYSFSRIGFHSGGYRGEQPNPKLPGNVCLAYGETPQQAYDKWCEIFKVWNDKEDWVK